MKIPRGLYDASHQGLTDPERVTADEVLHQSLSEALARRNDYASMSPVVRMLRATVDRALGRS